jgi:hypothetical protein
MISKTSKSLEVDSNVNSPRLPAPDLSTYYSKMFEKKPISPSGFVIPKMNFKSSKPTFINSNTTSSFNSLSGLTDRYLNISTENKEDSVKTVGSPFQFNIPKIPFKNTKSDNTVSFDSLNSLTTHHLKLFNNNESNKKYVSSPTIENIKNTELNDSSTVKNLIDQDLKSEKSIVTNFDLTTPNLDITDISNLSFEEKSNSDKNISNNSIELIKQSIKNEYIINYKNYKNFKLLQKSVSPFGKVLCKTYKRKMNLRKKVIIKVLEESESLLRFDFSSPSPYKK